MALVQDGSVHVASLGDSVCTLVKKDATSEYLSKKHTCKREDERDRIFRNKGVIIRDKVQGDLAVSRAIGNE